MWAWYLAGLLATNAHGFAPAPIRWGGFVARRFILGPAPRSSTDNALVPPLKLTVLDSSGRVSPDAVPQFSVNVDDTITWDAMGWCLEASGSNRGDAVQLSDCTGGPAQRWKWLAWGPIQLKGTNSCLDVIGTRSALDGASIGLQTCENKASESWMFEDAVSPPSPSEQHGIFLTSIANMAVAMTLGVSAWLWRWQLTLRPIAVSQHSLQHSMDSRCISLSENFATRQVRTPWLASNNASTHERVHAMMLQSPEPADDAAVEFAEGMHSEIVGQTLELVDISGKGKGYRARRNITAGEAILFETSFCSAKMGPGFYEDMAKQCETKAKKSAAIGDFFSNRVMGLETGGRMLGDSRLISILENNAFGASRDPGYVALFVAASRFNHSCCPNAFHDTSKDQITVRALRNIDAGEEVCISYLPVSNTRDYRQSKCMLAYGFACECARCKKEEREDPQFVVPCTCGKHNFTAQADALLEQSCPVCGSKFSKDEALIHLDNFKHIDESLLACRVRMTKPELESIFKMLEPVAALLEQDSSISKVPRAHHLSIKMLNHLSVTHSVAATLVSGAHRDASSRAAFFYQRKVLSAMVANHGDGTPQRDNDYFQSLHRLLMMEFPTAQEKAACEKEMEDLCLLQFGQADPPGGIVGLPYVQVQIPEGVGPGSVVQVRAPDGKIVQAQVPEGNNVGDVITLAYKPS